MYSADASSYLKEVALNALNCYAYHEGSQSTSDTAEERSYMSCPDIAACFNSVNTKKVVDYAWRPVTDSKLVVWLTRREVGFHMRMDKLLCHTEPRHLEAQNQHSR